MREPLSRWLLLLGSSRAEDASLRAALQRLGATTLLTPVQRFPADDGSARQFYNALAEWRVTDADGSAREQIRQVELALGRDRTRVDEVAIDIDLLAQWVGGQWCAHAHALDKHEFERALVLGLLRQAGVTIRLDAGGVPDTR